MLGLGGSKINQSEGFPRTGYFIPAHVGTGAGPDLSSFRRRRPAIFWAKKEARCLNIRVRGFPERDILSLRTLGLGLDRFGASFRRRFSKVGNPRK